MSSTQSKNVLNILKSIDTSSVTVNTVKLSAKTRTKPRNVKTQVAPLELLKEGIIRLSKPKSKTEVKANNWKIKKCVLKYKATERIKNLANAKKMPSKRKGKSSKQKSFPYSVPYATKRIDYLAQPRYIVPKATQSTIQSDSFDSNVSLRALNYVPSKRIKELARPKYFTIFEERFGDWLENELMK